MKRCIVNVRKEELLRAYEHNTPLDAIQDELESYTGNKKELAIMFFCDSAVYKTDANDEEPFFYIRQMSTTCPPTQEMGS